MDKPAETATELRMRAARTRRYALNLILDEAGPRLAALADELDARAEAMGEHQKLTGRDARPKNEAPRSWWRGADFPH
jgi:hypothetical protein